VTKSTVNLNELRASLEASRARAHELRTASNAIRRRLSATKQDLAEAVTRAQATREAAREHLASLRPITVEQSLPNSSSAVLQAIAALGRDENHLDAMTDDLIAAYQEAAAIGDEELQRLLAGALMQIGRHLARQVGPKAANIIMN
jgi:predicted transcriptional regulator